MTSPDKRSTRAAFWQPHILQWKTTQQTQIAYCRDHELSFHQFNYWLRKDEPVNTQKKKVADSASSAPSPFIPVVKHQSTLSGLSLSLPNGMVVQGIDSANLSAVKQLLVILS